MKTDMELITLVDGEKYKVFKTEDWERENLHSFAPYGDRTSLRYHEFYIGIKRGTIVDTLSEAYRLNKSHLTQRFFTPIKIFIGKRMDMMQGAFDVGERLDRIYLHATADLTNFEFVKEIKNQRSMMKSYND